MISAAPLPLFVLDQLGIIKKRVFDDTVETELKKKGKEAKEKTKKVPINEGKWLMLTLLIIYTSAIPVSILRKSKLG